jgi:hypothetical protein
MHGHTLYHPLFVQQVKSIMHCQNLDGAECRMDVGIMARMCPETTFRIVSRERGTEKNVTNLPHHPSSSLQTQSFHLDPMHPFGPLYTTL